MARWSVTYWLFQEDRKWVIVLAFVAWRVPYLYAISEARRVGHCHDCSSFYYWVWYLKSMKAEALWQVSLCATGSSDPGRWKAELPWREAGLPLWNLFWLHTFSLKTISIYFQLFSLCSFVPSPFSLLFQFSYIFFFHMQLSFIVSPSPSLSSLSPWLTSCPFILLPLHLFFLW